MNDITKIIFLVNSNSQQITFVKFLVKWPMFVNNAVCLDRQQTEQLYKLFYVTADLINALQVRVKLFIISSIKFSTHNYLLLHYCPNF